MTQNRQEIIGYEENKGFTSNGNSSTIENLSGFFITGFIPLGSTTKILAKYSSNNYSNNKQKFICEYNGSKTYNSNGYWAMTVQNERTVAVYTQSAEYIRFCGRLDSIDECFVKDADTGVVLWKKGM